jgi:hypothetical protein
MRKLGRITKFAALVVVGTGLLALSAQASIVVGTIKKGTPDSEVKETEHVNYLLLTGQGITRSGTGSDQKNTYDRWDTVVPIHPITVTGVQHPVSDGLTITGWEYVLAKYGGEDGGGDVVWYLGGASFTIPGTSADFWVNSAGQGQGISHYTVFNAVPEPTTMIAGALLLLPFGASTLRMLRKKQVA